MFNINRNMKWNERMKEEEKIIMSYTLKAHIFNSSLSLALFMYTHIGDVHHITATSSKQGVSF